MPAQLPTTDFQKLILQKCKLYKGTYVRDPFSGKLQKELIGIIDSIQEIANDDRSTRDNELSEKFGMMDTAIKAGWRVYYGRELTQAEIELHTLPLKNLKIDIEAALSEKKRAADLQQRIVLQQQQLQDAAKQENQQLRLQIQRLESELRESKAQLASLQEKTTAKINSLESALQAATDENTRLKESLKDAQNLVLAADGKVAAADGKVAAAERRAAVANGRVSAADASAAEAKQKEIELQQIVASQEARLKQVGDGNQQLQVQLEQSKKLAGEIEKEFSSKLSAKDRELESLQARALTAEGKVAAADEKAAVANGRVSEANTRAGQANEKASQAESESLKLLERIDELHGKLRLQDTTLQTDVTTIKGLLSQIDLLKQQLEQRESELQKKEATNQQLSDENGNLKADNARLASENKTLKQQLEDQRAGLESQQNLTDRVTSQAAELGVLQAKAGKADDRAKEAEKRTEELQRRLDSQTSELGQLRGNNVSLETKLGALESQLTQQDAAFAEQVAAKDAELKALQANAEAAEKQSSTMIAQQRQEIDRLKGEFERLNEARGATTIEKQALADQNMQANLELERLRKQLAITKLEKEELEVRNVELTTSQNGQVDGLMLMSSTQLKRIAELEEQLRGAETNHAATQKADKRKLKEAIIKIHQLGRQILDLQQGNRELQSQLNTEQPTSEPRANETLVKYGDLEEILQKSEAALVVSEKKLQMATKLSKASSELHDNPAIGLIEGKTVLQEATETDATPLKSPLSVLDGLSDELVSVRKESDSMLKHYYEEGDVAVKRSSYDPTNTENKFKNDGGEEVAALLAGSKTIVLEGDPPQKMRYTQDLDKDPTILAGALTLEGISESQPKGGHSVQATMEDCDDNEKFVLDVLIKFHERLNDKLNGANPEKACCTTIDYKGNNPRLREIIDAHNKAARIINAKDKTDLATKIKQAVSIKQAAEDIKKEIASPTIKPVTPRKNSM